MLTIERDGDQTLYRLLDTLREFGLARLRRDGRGRVRRVHAEYHLDRPRGLVPSSARRTSRRG
jgi:DNA-binding transcriptional ArsR family regulator